jgi:hypothetical protein
MIRWFKRFVYFALLLVILLPVTASAQSPTCPPTCYASYDGTADCNDVGTGTYDNQWKVTETNMGTCYEVASKLIRDFGQPGTLYWPIDQTHYAFHFNSNGQPTGADPVDGHPPPPVTGVDLPFPILLIGLTMLGAALLATGYLLRSRLFQTSKP